MLGLQSERLYVLQGEILDPQKVSEAVEEADAVISVLGPTNNQPTFEVSKGMANILAAMQVHSVRRLVVSCGASVRDPNDAPGLFDRVVGAWLKLTSHNVYEDMLRMVRLVQASDRAWTVVRVPMLTDAPKTGNVRVGYIGKGVGARLARSDLADFMVAQIKDTAFLRQAPFISN
jgi:putative NADH-flavin reductase